MWNSGYLPPVCRIDYEELLVMLLLRINERILKIEKRQQERQEEYGVSVLLVVLGTSSR